MAIIVLSGLFLFNQQQKLLYPKGTLEDAIPYRMMGIAGRATYSWKDRYFAEFNIGYNGAENFSPKIVSELSLHMVLVG